MTTGADDRRGRIVQADGAAAGVLDEPVGAAMP
jgi:hypothetical protein